MKKNVFLMAGILLLSLLLVPGLSGCGAISNLVATPTPTPTPTSIPTPTPTPIPIPYIQGVIHFTGQREDPFRTLIELHSKADFKNVIVAQTDETGVFTIAGIEPGQYQLWVLLNVIDRMLPGCNDVVFPENWKLGVNLGGAVILNENITTLNAAIDMVDFSSPGQILPSGATAGIFTVSPTLEVSNQTTLELEIVLTCK